MPGVASVASLLVVQGLCQRLLGGGDPFSVLPRGHIDALCGECPQHPLEEVQLGSRIEAAQGR